MLKFKAQLFLIFFLISLPAYALPLPEFASAVVSIGELLFILIAGLSLYFPFIKKRKNKTNFPLYLTSIIFALLLVYILAPEKVNYLLQINETFTQENRPGMVWREEDREKDPYSISESDAYKLMLEQKSAKIKKYFFIDARSRAETELGTATGFTKLSWIDLVTNYKEQVNGKTVIASCWTGMRGSEVCSKLREKGIDCKYLKKGFKGWTEADLPLSLAPNVSKENFGTADPSPNSENLLSAREAVNMKQKGVSIVDIRTPEEFKKDHIPGAINIPFNNIPTNELEYQIKILPPNGVIVSCYGEVSCSEAGLFGWEVSRTGAKYLGAYAGKTKAFNDIYNALNNSKKSFSVTDYITQKFVNIFSNFSVIYNITFLIFFTSTILGFLLWVTKERSIVYFQDLKLRKQENILLKTLLNDDDFAIKRERIFNFKSYLQNTLKSFIPVVLTLIYAFIIHVVYLSWSKENIFGQNNWKEQVNFSSLSILGTLMVTLSLTLIILDNKISVKKSLVAVPIFIMTLFSLKSLPQISVLMLCLSLSIMYLIQTIRLIKNKYNNWIISEKYKDGYLPLKDAYKVIPKDTKAGRLSFLINNGFRVPNGFIVRAGNIDRLSSKNEKTILALLDKEFAVRSSAMHEDMKDSSHAGLNLSVVPSTKNTWKKDMRDVFNSYGSKNKNEIILLQKCIQPIFSGAIFSKHPQWGGSILLEWGKGLSSKRMDGSEVSQQIVINRFNGKIVYLSNDNPQMVSRAKEIYELLLKVEDIYKEPLDIEWAIDTEGLWLLQARPQSALNNLSYNSVEKDREKLLNSQFENLNACELSFVMHNCSRLSASLICELWETSSSADYASRLALWKWNKKIEHQSAYIYAFGRIWNSNNPLLNKPNKLSWLAAKSQFEENFKDIDEESKKIIQETNINIVIDWSLLQKDSWLTLWNKSIKNWKRMQVFSFYFELMAQMAIEDVLKSCKNIGLNGEQLISNGANSFFSEDISYRAINDYEISMPRYIEQGKSHEQSSKIHLFGSLNSNTSSDLPSNIGKKLKEKILFARKLVYLREKSKHDSLSTFYLLRRGVLDAQNRLGINEEIFEMEYSEIPAIFSQNKEEFKKELKSRFKDKKKLQKIEIPDNLNADLVAVLGRNELSNSNNDNKVNTKGTFVSNPSQIDGVLLIIDEDLPLKEMEKIICQYGKDSIIYSKFVSAHLVNIAKSYSVKGLCSNYGSVLSHPSVLAREANLPFVIGVKIPEIWDNYILVTILESGEILKR